MTGPDPTSDARPSRLPGPEIIGSGLAVVVAAILVSAALAQGPGNPSASGSPGPSVSVQPVPEPPQPIVRPAVVELLRALNEQLASHGATLQTELERTTLRTDEVASTIRQVNATVRIGSTAVLALDGALGEDEPGGRMAAIYRSMGESASDTLDAALANGAAYRVGAAVLVDFISQLPALQAELELLAVPPSPSPTPSPSPPPPSSPPPTPSPTPTPTIAPPSTAPPTPPPASGQPADEQIENGGFESGVVQSWALFVAPGARATLSPDTVAPGAGGTSARVDITAGSPAYAGISLRQGGLQLEAGARYTVSLFIRSAAPRDLRIRVASSNETRSYVTRDAASGTAWAPFTFTFTASQADTAAVLSLDLGRSATTIWIDAVSFRAAGAEIASPSPSSSPSVAP